MSWWIIDLCVFLLNAMITGFVIPKILLVAFRKKLFDIPDERKIHHLPVPRLGGIAFCPVVICTLALLVGVTSWSEKVGVLHRFYPYLTEISLMTSSSILLYLVGMCDDLIGVRYSAKFVAQIISGIMLVASGIWISQFDGFLGLMRIPMWLGVPLTIVLVVFIINSINLIDGIDGLASGLCGVALFYYCVIYSMMNNLVYSIIAIAAFGTLVPFFYYNVFGDASQGRKIFMGDTGALTTGLLICFLSIKLCSVPVKTTALADYNPLVIAFAPLMIPCLDVVRVFGNRIMNHKNPFMPDRTHIHHKLLDAGFSQQVALIAILMVSIICSVGMVLLSKYVNVTILLLLAIAVYMLLNFGLNKLHKKNRGVQSQSEVNV